MVIQALRHTSRLGRWLPPEQANRKSSHATSAICGRPNYNGEMDGKPLWAAQDQQERLAELTASTDDPRKELPLRRDVRSLGILLGHVLAEQAGQVLFEVVEDLRRKFIAHRDRKMLGRPDSLHIAISESEEVGFVSDEFCHFHSRFLQERAHFYSPEPPIWIRQIRGSCRQH